VAQIIQSCEAFNINIFAFSFTGKL
jgi:hypothetical protein